MSKVPEPILQGYGRGGVKLRWAKRPSCKAPKVSIHKWDAFDCPIQPNMQFGDVMEKNEEAGSLGIALLSILLILCSSVSCTPVIAGQAAYKVAVVTVTAAQIKDPDKLQKSLQGFNDSFKFQDYTRASAFVGPDAKEKFWSEADRFEGKIRISEYALKDMQFDEQKINATAILNFEYWRMESPSVKTVLLTQKWQYSEKDKTWMVTDPGFEAIPSNSY